jgi:hypothetical protein
MWVPNFFLVDMRFFVKFSVFETNADDKPIRTAVGVQLQKLLASGKVESGGAFGGSRSGYMVINASSAVELQELIGLPMVTNMHIEVQPLMSFEELGAFFEKHMND